MNQKTLTEIDQAFDMMKEFGQLTKGTAANIQKMRQQAIFADGVVPAKYKALAAVLWSISARCEPCITFYVQEAAKKGVTREELGEYLAVGSTMGGCVGEMWSLKAFKAFVDVTDGKKEADGEASCCSH